MIQLLTGLSLFDVIGHKNRSKEFVNWFLNAKASLFIHSEIQSLYYVYRGPFSF